jgi:hypothetical protein
MVRKRDWGSDNDLDLTDLGSRILSWIRAGAMGILREDSGDLRWWVRTSCMWRSEVLVELSMQRDDSIQIDVA